MNIFFLLPLIILLAICINSKYNLKIEINNYNVLLITLIIIILLINEIYLNKKKLEDFISYPIIKKEFIPDKKLYRQKQFYDIKSDNQYEYQDLKVTFQNMYSIVKHKDTVYLSSNIFTDNSRLINRYLIKKDMNNNEWINPIEMRSLYNLPANEIQKNNNNKYYIDSIKLKNLIFFTGGKEKYNDNYNQYITIWDTNWNIWHNYKFPSKEPRCNIDSFVNENKVYFAGGYKGGKFPKCFSNKVDIYDISKGHYSDNKAWSHEILPSGGRINIKISNIGEKVFFCSGYNNKVIDSIDIYNPSIEGYKWTTIQIPSLLVNLNLNVTNLDDKLLFNKGLNYNHNIILDNNMFIHFNNKKVHKKVNNVLKLSYILSEEEHNGLFGTAYKCSHWIQQIYKLYLNQNFKNQCIDTWVYVNQLENGFFWIYGNNNYHASVYGLVMKDKKLYPTVKLDSRVYIYTDGIKPDKFKWNHINLSVDEKGNGIFYVNLVKTTFKVDFKINMNINENGLNISGIKLLNNSEISNFWLNGYISYMAFITDKMSDLQYHKLHMYNLNRFDNPVTNKNNLYNTEEIEYYTKTYDTPQLLVYTKNKFLPYDQFFPLTRKLYDNMNSIRVNSRYIVFYGNKITEHNFVAKLQPKLFIYDSKENLWYEKNNDHNITSKINTSDNNWLILGGIEEVNQDIKPLIYVLQFPDNVVDNTPKKKPPNVHCVPGQKKVNNKCIDCGIDEYSKFHNSLTCNKCPPFTNTNNKKKQTECIYEDIFDKPKKLNIRNNTQVEINKDIDKYNKQINKNNEMDLYLKSTSNSIVKIIENYKKNTF